MKTITFLLTKKAQQRYKNLVGIQLDNQQILDEFSRIYVNGNVIVTKNVIFVYENDPVKENHSYIVWCDRKKPGKDLLNRSPLFKMSVKVVDTKHGNKLLFLTPLEITTLITT